MQFEIHDPHVIAGLQRKARELHRPVTEFLEYFLRQKLSEAFDEHEMSPSEQVRVIREKMLAAHGGKPFSDSTIIIRESRDHDH